MVTFGTLSGCSQTQMVRFDVQEVEGRVTVRGNEPFTAVILETEERNWYVLDLTPEQRLGLVNPSIQRVVGEVYRGDWNGNAFARIRVSEIRRINR